MHVWSHEKVGLSSLVVSCVKYLTWMLLLAPSMERLVFVKHILEMEEADILKHFSLLVRVYMTIRCTLLSQPNFFKPIGGIAPVTAIRKRVIS